MKFFRAERSFREIWYEPERDGQEGTGKYTIPYRMRKMRYDDEAFGITCS
jgi:hypothetical protein